jgi:large subunit ribosomal protein L1
MILGPRGLMPNPKTGTVTPKVDEAVLNIKKGMIAYKNDSYGIIHTIIGKSSFEDKKLLENLNYAVATIAKAKPSSVKGVFVDSVSISSTMGPGIKLDKNNFDI